MSRVKKVVLVQPTSAGGNFEYVAIPRQGMLFLSGALEQWKGPNLYEREIWFEDRYGLLDPDSDLEGVDILMVSALINEAPRGYEIARLAKLYHPDLVTIGGGPLMSPLAEEAMQEGKFDVIANREGEDIIGQLCDLLLAYRGDDRLKELSKVPGISYMQDSHLVQTARRGLVEPDFVELPDFRSIKGLSPGNPMHAGVLETVRGCTEKCTYCQVIQQFLGYRMIKRETEIKRLAQLHQLAADGLIYTSSNGRFAVFVSDDLHPPPLRAVKYRNERLERIKTWKNHTEGMYMICQSRAEIGQDPELASALKESGMEMLYIGVESDNALNLELVKKRQDPGQVHKDMETLNAMDFTLVAMTIIGLPYDTEESITTMANWVTKVSKYQTANLLTPLPATSNWLDLTPLDEDGSVLPEGKMRPYHLYTGRQFVHVDERWSMKESQRIFDQYSARLNQIDNLYERMDKVMRRQSSRLAVAGMELRENIAARINHVSEALKSLSVAAGRELTDSISVRIEYLSESLRAVAESAGLELTESISSRISQISENLRAMTDSAGKELTETISKQIRQASDSLRSLADFASKPA